MTAGSWPEFLGRLGSTWFLYGIYRICRPAAGRHVLRARSASGDAHPDGPAPARATGAGPLNTTGRRRLS